MRFLLVLLISLLAGFTGQAQTTAVTWNANLTQALQQAKATNKPILAVFSGSDWCKPCIMLKQEVFDQPEFQKFAQEKLVLARFDFPRSKKNKLPAEQTKLNEAAAAQFNKEGSFPLVVLISPEGKVLAKTGYRPGGPAAYDAYLSQLLTKR
ncbi:thioredoxin family protein [Hymenobacter taeanensis]|uniref:Thioredoxin family protein n=1 Tax=Hymenobacter taeanensis TaxID=2735321 RepID=A0A6M6BEN2_9BACT|nr:MULTISPECIES: thioredoxin family protein [Hymenobacter]QJX45673.1 thioredoxin family protein [Hymenobacter taeanensis]UOQ79509.1 thioredoxin family protein [Hymenobacter sp. 5414T-23]